MNKKLTLFILAILFSSQFSLAQDRQISGTVTFADTVKGAMGMTVNVGVKGTTIGTSTDEMGRYTLNVPPSASKLVFSFVGMKTVEEKIAGRSIINVQLTEDAAAFEAVVITALGLKGERDKFASSVSTLKGNTLAQSGETGVLNGLSGKAAGVLVTRNGGDSGAGSYIQIRGQNTIYGNAQPLFILDGMPVSNSSDNIGAARSNGIVQQSRINDINPEDIERVEVLKGASAAAIWGSKAANGVIVDRKSTRLNSSHRH